MIAGWGLGVNTLPPLLKTLEVADPDIFLSACQYSLVYHEEALETLFPKCEEQGVSVMVGAPLNFGFLAGRDRYNYGATIPDGMLEKRAAMQKVADEYDVDLRTAALQFSREPQVVKAVIPGARNGQQATENAKSFEAEIPKAFWEDLKSQELIAANAPVPA
jgi:D-threo-aldose 1-dehydrogenase